MTLFATQRAHVALVVAYDGTDFHGFASQPGQRTVAGALIETLEQSLRGDVGDFACAGRTDAGVHAWGQVVSFSTAAELDLDQLTRSINRRLGPEIVVRDARPGGFRFRRPPFGAGSYVSVHGREPPRPGPVPRSLRLVGSGGDGALPAPPRCRSLHW